MQAHFLAHELSRFKRIWKPLGFFCAASFTCYRIFHRLGLDSRQVLRLQPRGCVHALDLRVPESSDVDVFLQVFAEGQYRPLREIRQPKVILDCGANVGYSSIYFLKVFPDARVIALEPDPENFRICAQNLAPYHPRVQLLQAAVWGSTTRVALERGSWRDGRDWAIRVREVNAEDKDVVGAMDIPSLLELIPNGVVDLLKIDIEESELELFRCDPHRWLPSIRNIAVELHGPNCEQVFFEALDRYSYDISVSGELTICRNIHTRE